MILPESLVGRVTNCVVSPCQLGGFRIRKQSKPMPVHTPRSMHQKVRRANFCSSAVLDGGETYVEALLENPKSSQEDVLWIYRKARLEPPASLNMKVKRNPQLKR